MDTKNINKDITLKIEGRITLEKFSKSIRTFFNMIKDVSADVAGKHKTLEWLIEVRPGSAVITAKPESRNGSPELAYDTISVLKKGIEYISMGMGRPEHFSDSALSNLYELGDIVGLGNKDIEHIKIGIDEEYKDITPMSISYIGELLGTVYQAYGTIEGNLLALKIRNRLNFSIYETLTGKEVKCFFDDDLYEDVIAAIRKRVSVYGLIQYNKNGIPIRVTIEKLTIFPDDSELPKFKDIIGLFKD